MNSTNSDSIGRKLRLSLAGLSLLVAAGALTACSPSKPDPAPLGSRSLASTSASFQVYAGNPHYFSYQGHPTLLLGVTGKYMMAGSTDQDYVSFLNTEQSYGFNVARLFVGSPWNWTTDRTQTYYLAPWIKTSSGKYDLSQWNQDYFNRLTDYVSKAQQRGIMVEVVLFSDLYSSTVWQTDPFYYANNIQGVGNIGWDRFTTMDDPNLVGYQDAFVKKIATVLNGYDNVYYELTNEPDFTQSGVKSWEMHILQTLVDTESTLTKRHLVGWEEDTSDVTTDSRITHYNSHYDGGGGASFPGIHLLDSFYSYNKPLAINEACWPGWTGESLDSSRAEAWEFMVGGGAEFDGVYDPDPGTGATTLRGYFKILKTFMQGFDFWNMKPSSSLIQGGVPSGAYARISAWPGHQYAFFIHHSQDHGGFCYSPNYGTYQEDISLSIASGTYVAEWIDPKSGNVIKTDGPFTWSGGVRVFKTPTYTYDLALSIKATTSSCTHLSFNGADSSASPSTVAPGGSYTVSCDYGLAAIPYIHAIPGSGTCTWTGWKGTAAIFNCIAGTTAGTFANSCQLISNPTYCTRTDAINSTTVEAVGSGGAGGAGGTGGNGATGGTSGAAGATGAAGGNGAAGSSAGGNGAAGTSASGGAHAGTPTPNDSSGCSCRIVPNHNAPRREPAGALLLVAGVAITWKRRRGGRTADDVV